MAQNTLLNYCVGTLAEGSYYAMSTATPILNLLPFTKIHGNSYSWNVIDTLLPTEHRDLGQDIVADEMAVTKVTKPMTILTNSVKVDRAISVMNDLSSAKAEAQALAMKSSGKALEGYVVESLRAYATNNEAGVKFNEALSINVLDDMIDTVEGANIIFVNKKMHRNLKALLKDEGMQPETTESFGKRVVAYAGIPVHVTDALNDYEVLVVKFADDGVHAVTPAGLNVYEKTVGVFDITDTELIYQICPKVKNAFAVLETTPSTLKGKK